MTLTVEGPAVPVALVAHRGRADQLPPLVPSPRGRDRALIASAAVAGVAAFAASATGLLLVLGV
ncbi:hypothetical protein [Schumannella sp. 10F1B-5-1]|uniref:hypothetical protein n=1 Tax=Schumannella sp. 10F1B-5-1 TaxID=2590780 RepID=UPI0011325103|nr:hypothetical protein [Schumannella sp. 10F1B-5-1]TPW78340.1 hypothetical protein FJ658_00590 [Schumannella sp. 10F1B-5-1]